MSVYFNSFYPLGCTKEGRAAAFLFSLPLYIDGSYRREPDFEHSRPCLTGVSKPGLFKKYRKGDLIVYATSGMTRPERRVVAVLKIIELMPDHETAAKWYTEKKLKIPNNLMISKTKPVSPDETHGLFNHFGCNRGNSASLDEKYSQRSQKSSVVAICRIWKKQVNLFDPPILKESDRKRIFGNIVVKDGSNINNEQWQKLGLFLIKRNSRRARKAPKKDKPIAFVLPGNKLSF